MNIFFSHNFVFEYDQYLKIKKEKNLPILCSVISLKKKKSVIVFCLQ